MRSRLFPLVSCVLLASLAAPASAKPAPAELAPRVDQIFAEYGAGSPGCALGVVRDGGLVYSKGYGLASLEHGVPLTPQTALDIGSIAKQFTATTIILLAQDGKLSVDDDVRKFIPEMPDYGTPITLRHLLHHTSGIRDYNALLTLGGINLEDVSTQEEGLAIIARQKALNFHPGDEHSYSNSGYFLLSVVVERVSGKTMRAFAQERIFGPLGMTNTQYLDDHTLVIPRRASSYMPRPDRGFRLETCNWEQTGDGGILTTVEDLAKWDRNFYDPKVGGPTLIEQLQTTGVLNNGEKIDYARGLIVDEYRGLRRVSHNGGWVAFVSEMTRFPDERLSVITLCNVGNADPTGLALQVADLYLADRMKPADPKPEAPTAAPQRSSAAVDLSSYPGLFFNPTTGQVLRIHARDGKLSFEQGPGNEIELAPLGPDRFAAVDFPVPVEMRFSTSSAGLREVRIHVPNDVLVFQSVEPASLSAADRASLAGTYFSEELDIAYTLAVEEGNLVLKHANRLPARVLQPAFADTFTAPGVRLLRLTRDAGKKVTGFTISSGRIRDIGFTRVPGSAKALL
ncbi:MAG TPA: serine hydrolase domain-containing protein [Thermoanaerobaculia bacterium]|nr:serine hydrolase domain-containing protein [Thermoanaerobaculia bacterium]